jgi:small subunit ribosomal protein S21
MAKVIVRKNESADRAMKRFKRKVEREGIMRDVKKNRYYRKPSVRKKEKKKAAAQTKKINRCYVMYKALYCAFSFLER